MYKGIFLPLKIAAAKWPPPSIITAQVKGDGFISFKVAKQASFTSPWNKNLVDIFATEGGYPSQKNNLNQAIAISITLVSERSKCRWLKKPYGLAITNISKTEETEYCFAATMRKQP